MFSEKLRQKKNNRWAITDRMFLSLFLTGSIVEFSQVGAGLVDGLMVSRFLGAQEMAAQGIVQPVFSILGIISGLLAAGMQTRCAQAIGRGNREEYVNFASAAVYVGGIVSLICTALLLVFAKPFTVVLGASGNAVDLLEPASRYLFGISLGAPALIMTVILAPALQLDTGRKVVQTGAIIEAVCNVMLDIIAVKLGWGIFGIGIATAVASYMNLLYLCTFFLKKDRMLHFVKPDVPVGEFMQMLTNGSEKVVRRVANTLRPVILNAVIISYGGTAAMSALAVRNNFSNFSEILGAGIASAVALLVGLYFGEMNEEGIEATGKQAHRMIGLFPGFACVLVLLFAKQIAHLYIPDDGAVYDMTLFAIRMLAIQIPLQALIESRIQHLQAIQRNRNANALTIIARFAFVILSAFILGRLFGSYGILACYTVSDAFTLVAIYLYYAMKCRSVKPKIKDFLNLPDSLHLKPGDVISLDVRSVKDASLVSKQIMLFCSGHNINHKTAFYSSLAFEELASNVVLYGFPVCSSSQPLLDVRVVISENALVIRMRDNCPKYDVTKQIAAVNEEGSDPMHNIGTRVVSKIASDITYMNTFDTNNLIVRFALNR